MRAELVCGPICTLEEKRRLVKVVFSFRAIDPGGEMVELSWADPRPQENGKYLGGTARCSFESQETAYALEVGMPLGLFLNPSRINLSLRTLEPMRSLGHGNGWLGADPEDVSGTVHFHLRSWTDLT